MRTSNVNLQFQINAGPQRNAGTLNKEKASVYGALGSKMSQAGISIHKIIGINSTNPSVGFA